MASNIVELFGYSTDDKSAKAQEARDKRHCPFHRAQCTKTLSDGEISGVCTLKPVRSGPVVCCPERLYADDYRVLKDIAASAFGQGTRLISRDNIGEGEHDGNTVAVFGKRMGGELRLPARKGLGSYFVDWVLARLDEHCDLAEFVAVEVQSIDTTGNYRGEREAVLSGKPFEGTNSAGLNWENVNKRILPQLIYKGHVLRREKLCAKGLFFVCPAPVYRRIDKRLGGQLEEYPPDKSTITFRWYDLGDRPANGNCRPLQFCGEFTTTVDQLSLAMDRAQNLPAPGVYEQAIRRALGQE